MCFGFAKASALLLELSPGDRFLAELDRPTDEANAAQLRELIAKDAVGEATKT